MENTKEILRPNQVLDKREKEKVQLILDIVAIRDRLIDMVNETMMQLDSADGNYKLYSDIRTSADEKAHQKVLTELEEAGYSARMFKDNGRDCISWKVKKNPTFF